MNIFCIRPKGYNIGNDAIFLAMRHFLKTVFGYAPNIITLPASTKYESHAKAGLTAATIYEMNQYGNGVIVGGGNLYENNELDVDLNALNSLEIPLFLFSLSRGRIYNRYGVLADRTDVMPDEKLLRLNQKALLTLARDKVTQNYIRTLGIGSCGLCACPTLFLNAIASTLPEVSHQERGLTLISIRHPSLMSIPLKKQAEVIESIRAIAAYYTAEGHNVKLLCHDRRDIPFAAGFVGVEYLYIEDVHVYLSLLKACRLNISFRLHATLPCLSFERPIINISYDDRAKSLIETIGFGECNIDIMETPDILAGIREQEKRLGELPRLKSESLSTWDGFHLTISDAFCTFAAAATQTL